jgi:hypothetical protein
LRADDTVSILPVIVGNDVDVTARKRLEPLKNESLVMHMV